MERDTADGLVEIYIDFLTFSKWKTSTGFTLCGVIFALVFDILLLLFQNCSNKRNLLEGTGNIHSISPEKTFSGCQLTDISGVPHYKCEAGKTFGTPSERWWYIVIENCASQQVSLSTNIIPNLL